LRNRKTNQNSNYFLANGGRAIRSAQLTPIFLRRLSP
jgi:hypothetical protein